MTTPTPSPMSPQPVDLIVDVAVKAGWTHRAGFECALQLLLHGVSVAEARAAFELCERVIQ